MSNRQNTTLARIKKYIKAATKVRDPECAFHLKVLSRALIALELGDRDRISTLIKQSEHMIKSNPYLGSILQQIEQSAFLCEEPTVVQKLASSDKPATELTSELVQMPILELSGEEAAQLARSTNVIPEELASLTLSFEQQKNQSKQPTASFSLLTTENTGFVGEMLNAYYQLENVANQEIGKGPPLQSIKARQIPAPA